MPWLTIFHWYGSCLPRSPRSVFLFPSSYIPVLSEAVAGSTLNDCSNPIFTEKLDKTELPLGTFECSPCARGKMLVLCVGEEGQEEVNAFCLIFEIYFSLYSGSWLCRNFTINKEIYTSTWIPKFPGNSVEFQLTYGLRCSCVPTLDLLRGIWGCLSMNLPIGTIQCLCISWMLFQTKMYWLPKHKPQSHCPLAWKGGRTNFL